MRWTQVRIRRLRRRYAETQAAFAQRLGVGANAVSAWEQGLRGPSKPICRLLDILDDDHRAGHPRPHPESRGRTEC